MPIIAAVPKPEMTVAEAVVMPIAAMTVAVATSLYYSSRASNAEILFNHIRKGMHLSARLKKRKCPPVESTPSK